MSGTRAAGQLLGTFWARYVQAYSFSGDDIPFGSAEQVFEEAVLAKLRATISVQALLTPVYFTEILSNRVLAACLAFQDSSHAIAINARFKADPEVIAHTLVEEFAHVQQLLDGVDFEAQRHQFAYHERPYEQEAKQTATDLLGYDPGEEYDVILVREERDNVIGR